MISHYCIIVLFVQEQLSSSQATKQSSYHQPCLLDHDSLVLVWYVVSESEIQAEATRSSKTVLKYELYVRCSGALARTASRSIQLSPTRTPYTFLFSCFLDFACYDGLDVGKL